MPKKLTVALIRGAFLNPNELENYSPLVKNVKIRSFSSILPLGTSKTIANTKLFSPFDIGEALPTPLAYPVKKITQYLLNRIIGDPHYLYDLEKQLAPFDIIDIPDPYYYYSYQAAKFKTAHPQKILLSTYCETIPFNNESVVKKKRLKRMVTKIVDGFICHTERSRSALLREGVPTKKINIIKLGVDLNRFKPKPKPELNILFVGRLVPEKGIELAWSAFHNLAPKYPQVTLTIVGQGSQEVDLKAQIRAMGLSKRVKIKSVGYKQMPEIYQQASILIAPSYQTPTWEEQYGMVLIEAMASGLAIVTTKSGAIPEIVGKAGLVVHERKQKQLSQALERLLSDNSLRIKLGILARDRAEKYFNREQFADTILTVYEKYYRLRSG